jgi:Pentapeptide repeats (8 copies)
MANDEQVALLKQGAAAWNAWCGENPDIHPDFSGADLSPAPLLCEANLSGANLYGANLSEANFRNAHLRGAKLNEADLSGANLYAASLVDTDLTDADLTSCRIYGVSAWRLKLEGAKQQNFIITKPGEPEITVDNIEVAQFVYLLLHNEKVRDVIDTITSKIVLILGRFTPERKAVLDALREELRGRDYLPILFDFDKPASRDITETISLLARMARFVPADITDARSIPQELNIIVPDLPSVPVQPLLLKESGEYGMFEHYTRYPWVQPLSERIVSHGRKLGMQLGVGIETDEDRGMAAVLQTPRGIMDWIATPNFLDMRP